MTDKRTGIWGETDTWVDRILDYCIEKIKSDIEERTLQRETAIGACEEVSKPEPTEDYYRGFDDGLRTAMITIGMIKDGDI